MVFRKSASPGLPTLCWRFQTPNDAQQSRKRYHSTDTSRKKSIVIIVMTPRFGKKPETAHQGFRRTSPLTKGDETPGHHKHFFLKVETVQLNRGLRWARKQRKKPRVMANRPIRRSCPGASSRICRNQRCIDSGEATYGSPSRTRIRPIKVTINFINPALPESKSHCNPHKAIDNALLKKVPFFYSS